LLPGRGGDRGRPPQAPRGGEPVTSDQHICVATNDKLAEGIYETYVDKVNVVEQLVQQQQQPLLLRHVHDQFDHVHVDDLGLVLVVAHAHDPILYVVSIYA
jgi:hypothetical protein